MDDNRPIAHTSEDGRSHALEKHLEGVSKLAAVFAQEFSAGEWAALAGLWHDLGKYSVDFQKYIRSQSSSPDHSTYGARKAVEKFDKLGRILAYLIAGHHAGLPDWQSETSGMSGLAQRLYNKRLPVVSSTYQGLTSQELPSEKPKQGTDPSMWIRMLFSCLVDADFLDTEAFMDARRSETRSNYTSLEKLQPLFIKYMAEKTAGARKSVVNKLRAEILEQCVAKSEEPPSIFSLTVPTGGGKTLSSMAFALNHALRHGKRRIIYVIPYTSIIEQTADQFREIFGDEVLEHHSNIESSKEITKSRLASENWDAPIIVTTTVQFFESLYASRTSRCRKLHNIVNSVVILDETQLLPPDFLKPILTALKELQKNYGVTLLLSTATQPALESRSSVDFNFEGLAGIKEIIEEPDLLHARLKRVRVEVPADLSKERPWDELALELSEYPSVLCVVNRRDDCRELHGLMPEGTVHLSALMCGAHRSDVISAIKKRLLDNTPTRVISTQLVEAGVDVDFPVVYRALAGLDSIAQAAGRCNREGLLQEGIVKVFVPYGKTPPGYLSQAAEIGRRLLSEEVADPLAPERFTDYFKELYWLRGERLDKKDVLKDLYPDPELRFSFRTAAREFRIIDGSRYEPVLVRHGKGGDLIETLIKKGPERGLMRSLQRYVVNVPKYYLDTLIRNGEIEEIYEGIYVQSKIGRYDEALGLCYGSGVIEADNLVV